MGILHIVGSNPANWYRIVCGYVHHIYQSQRYYIRYCVLFLEEGSAAYSSHITPFWEEEGYWGSPELVFFSMKVKGQVEGWFILRIFSYISTNQRSRLVICRLFIGQKFRKNIHSYPCTLPFISNHWLCLIPLVKCIVQCTLEQCSKSYINKGGLENLDMCANWQQKLT